MPSRSKPPADDERTPPGRVSRHIQPLGPRVLVRVIKSPDRSESGLFLPAGAKDSHSEALLAEVVEVARTMPKPGFVLDGDDDDDDEPKADLGENVSGIPVGAQVLFAKDQGIAVPWDESLRILGVRHVLAIVDIISEDHLQ
ncbi:MULTISPECIES: co-chaperone GroES [Nannocystis]|jgi:co-chaperonin GroES (HSP10)|uniref:Co-chaperone GroES n=2 Tax=Nannocystis TaxID=53 RepID=A0ABS7TYX2_9BACT|nr:MULTISPECIES: co-chaperone GroES [Nannocystis]MBZ5713236.1 co-chaperone GroES [Nannocystis pusilla]MCY1053840.1 co-chaperone GroES [Nannocystis sp. SCPEA4]MDC0667280.1 co-chaperone GroES [Nannocystis radixulma]